MSKETKIGYMCGINFQHEISKHNPNVIELFGSVEALQDKMKCTEECGIVKVSITVEEWVIKQDFLAILRGE